MPGKARRFSIAPIPLLALMPVGILSYLFMLWITPHGLGITPDSIIYIDTARSLLSGEGFYALGKPMTHYPPAYPVLLAIAGSFHPDLLAVTRHLHAFFYSVNAVLFALTVFLCARRRMVAALCATLIFIASRPILMAHAAAQSEAPFITFSLASFLLFALHAKQPRLLLIFLASFLLSIAVATRYVGIALLPPALLGLLMFGNTPPKRRLLNTIFFLFIACLPIAAWTIRNNIVADTPARNIAIHPATLSHLRDLAVTLHDYVLPVSGPVIMKAGAVLLLGTPFLLAIGFLFRRRYLHAHWDSMEVTFPVLSVCFAIAYLVLVLISISFFDGATPLDSRICLPVFLFLTAAGISLAHSVSRTMQSPIIWWGFFLCIALSVSINSTRTLASVRSMRTIGSGYSSPQWNESQTLAFVKTLRKDQWIFSNGPDIIRFKAGHRASMIPQRWNPVTKATNTAYKKDMLRMHRECLKGRVMVIYFHNIDWRPYLPTEAEMAQLCGEFPVLFRGDDGTVFGTKR